MTTTTWRDLAAGAQPFIPAAPVAGVPAPTPNWRDLAQPAPQPPVQQPVQPPAYPAGYPQPGYPPQPQAPQPYPWPPQPPAAPGAPGQGAAGAQQAWQAAQPYGATPLTPQPTAPSPAPPGDPAQAAAAVGMRLAQAGAAATDVDTGALLAMIQQLQAQMAQMTAAQGSTGGPDVVKFATAFADHLQAKADAHPVINADPTDTYIPALQKAAELVNTAHQVAATGQGHEGLVNLAREAVQWTAAHARKFPAIDYDYILELGHEVASAAAKLLAV